MRSVQVDILEGLHDFVDHLESGEPIPVTVVRREQTPDGPLHTATLESRFGIKGVKSTGISMASPAPTE